MWYLIRPPSQYTDDPTINDALLMWLLITLLGLIAITIGLIVGLTVLLRFVIYLPIKGVKSIYALFRRVRIWINRGSSW